MRFPAENNDNSNDNKVILVISDLHLSAGALVFGRKNPLEDFFFDRELIDFLKYYSSAEYREKEVELILNGDFLDFLAVPFVPFFDDEYWKEDASIVKLKMIMEAHKDIFVALKNFISEEIPNKKIIYILGNHDAEMLFPQVRKIFNNFLFGDNDQLAGSRFLFNLKENCYRPHKKILIKHGHEYESAHSFSTARSIIRNKDNQLYFLPSWGAYYVIRVINKFKEQRYFINAVRPIRTFIIYGMIFDTLFTIRFLFANFYYVIMVIFLSFLRQTKKSRPNIFKIIKSTINSTVRETKLFQDYESLTREEFINDEQLRLLIVGHTHVPSMRTYADGTVFINTGSWPKIYNLDLARQQEGHQLTYAIIDIDNLGKLESHLLVWEGHRNLPYSHFIA
ncbi:MAG: metallophosphoesterase [Oligoflexia bacterium]|nr:metallophosphoesterase [Oligoflexia bacterium]